MLNVRRAFSLNQVPAYSIKPVIYNETIVSYETRTRPCRFRVQLLSTMVDGQFIGIAFVSWKENDKNIHTALTCP